jgi:predicted branched-subunit amino acid permease
MTGAIRSLDRAGAYRLGLIDGGQVPAIALITSMMSYGSLVRESGIDFFFAIGSSAFMWALPGQIALVELHTSGASLFAAVLAVAMANARFFPMTATMVPLFRDGVRRKVWLYPLSHFITFNSWLWVVRRFPELSQSARVWYFMGFGTVCYISGLAGTTIGYYVAGWLPSGVMLGLVYLVVIYFIVMLADIRKPIALAAVIGGGIAGPLFHLLSEDWGLLFAGVVGGTVAFFVSRHLTARRAVKDG